MDLKALSNQPNKGLVLSLILIILLFVSLFFDKEANTAFNWLILITSLFVLINVKILPSRGLKFYLKIIGLISLSILGGYFDFKNYLNQIGFILISLAIIRLPNNKYSDKIIIILRNYFWLFISAIIFGYSLWYSSILNLDINTYYLKLSQLIGLEKQLVGQLIVFPSIIVALKFKKIKKFTLYLFLIPLIFGARSVLFGFLCFLIILFLKNNFRLKPIYTFYGIYAFHIILVYIIEKYTFLHILYEIDPRWGMQLISKNISSMNFLGIGFAGWNEYLEAHYSDLMIYQEYLPSWLNYIKNNIIPTTLESSLFQLNVEIGILPTFLIYYICLKEAFHGYFNSRNEIHKIVAISYIVLTFATFYQDSLFTTIWYIYTSILIYFNSYHDQVFTKGS